MTSSEISDALAEDVQARFERAQERFPDRYQAAVAAICGDHVVNDAIAEGGDRWMDYLPPQGSRVMRLLGFPIR